MVDSLVSKILNFLKEGKRTRVRKILSELSMSQAALVIDQIPDRMKMEVYSLLHSNRSSDVLLELAPRSRKLVLKRLKDAYIISLVETSESDDSADILREVPHEKRKGIFEKLTRKKKESILPLIKHEEDTAGGLMQSELISLSEKLTVSQTIVKVRELLKHVDSVSYLYIVDAKQKLKGVVSMSGLIAASKTKKLGQIMTKSIITLSPTMDKEKVAAIFQEKDILALPVVDDQGILLGRVTVDDVLDVLQEEATEDILKMAGVSPDESIFDPIRHALKTRLPWLVVNLFTAVLAGITVALFKETIQSVVILAAFLPIIAGMGGNAGTQTLTLMVRSLALNQLNSANYARVIWKETALGFVNGIVTGTITALAVFLWLHNLPFAIVILSSMTISLSLAGCIGTSIPLVLKSLKIDPAVASSIFITTFTDVIGFLSFLGIATLMLSSL